MDKKLARKNMRSGISMFIVLLCLIGRHLCVGRRVPQRGQVGGGKVSEERTPTQEAEPDGGEHHAIHMPLAQLRADSLSQLAEEERSDRGGAPARRRRA